MSKRFFDITKSPNEDGFLHFDKYFIFIKNLGAGRYGKVVLAEDPLTGRQYAVKVTPLFKTENNNNFKSASKLQIQTSAIG